MCDRRRQQTPRQSPICRMKGVSGNARGGGGGGGGAPRRQACVVGRKKKNRTEFSNGAGSGGPTEPGGGPNFDRRGVPSAVVLTPPQPRVVRARVGPPGCLAVCVLVVGRAGGGGTGRQFDAGACAVRGRHGTGGRAGVRHAPAPPAARPSVETDDGRGGAGSARIRRAWRKPAPAARLAPPRGARSPRRPRRGDVEKKKQAAHLVGVCGVRVERRPARGTDVRGGVRQGRDVPIWLFSARGSCVGGDRQRGRCQLAPTRRAAVLPKPHLRRAHPIEIFLFLPTTNLVVSALSRHEASPPLHKRGVQSGFFSPFAPTCWSPAAPGEVCGGHGWGMAFDRPGACRRHCQRQSQRAVAVETLGPSHPLHPSSTRQAPTSAHWP